MTAGPNSNMPSDAELVAYLDGELSPADSVRLAQKIAADPALAARIDLLQRGMRPFGEAFEPLLREAPTERLDALLATAERQVLPVADGFVAGLRRRWPAAIAAGLALLVLGAGLDRFVVQPASEAVFNAGRDEAADWRRAVARYLALYTNDTLAAVSDVAAPNGQDIARLGQRLGLDLTPGRVELAGLSPRRADIYDYDGKPLAFLAYLDPHNGPLALCIEPGLDGSAPPRVEHRRGMNVVYWTQAHHGFMLIGRANIAQLQALATSVADRFDGTGPDRI